MIPLVDLKAQYRQIKPEIDDAIAGVLESAQFIQGKNVRAFEEEFADYCGAQYGIGVASGTAALYIALWACGIKAGDEVITTPFTFIATVEAIVCLGATPVLVDIDPVTFNINPAQVEAAITERTRAIVPVHLFGHPVDMNPLLALAQRHNIRIIEDAAQAHGAEYQGRKCGSLGTVGCFSFYPSKTLGAYGDGGMITTNDAELAHRIRRMKDHGREEKYTHIEVGLGERLDEIQAAILRVKLRYLQSWIEKRRAIASLYRDLLAESPVALPQEKPYGRHTYYMFVLRAPCRDEIVDSFQRENIGVGVYYPIPAHLQPAYQYLGYREGEFPHSEAAAKQAISIPMYPEMTEEQAVAVANCLNQALRTAGVA